MLIVGLVVALGVLYWIRSRHVDEQEEVVAEAVSTEGLRVVIHRVDLAKEMTILGPRASFSLSKFVGVTEGGESSFGLSRLRTNTKNGRFDLARFSRQTPSLFILARAFDQDGKTISTDDVKMRVSSFAGGVRALRDENGIFDGFDRAGGVEPSLQIEVADGAGGWISTDGPLIPSADDGRAFFMCPCFPRATPELELRLRFAGDREPQLVRVPNPGYRKTFPTWTPDPEPWVQEFGDVAVSVKEIDALSVRSVSKADVELEILSRSEQASDAWVVNWLGMSDRFGNEAGPHWRFLRIPGVKLVRYEYEIERSPVYRWPLADLEILGEVVWSVGAKPAKVKLTAAGEALGLKKLDLSRTGEKLFVRYTDLDEWKINIEAETASEADAPSPNLPMTLILGDEEQSTGAAVGIFEGEWAVRSNGKFRIEGEFEWGGDIQPGQRVRIAVPKSSPKPIPFSFTFSTDVLDRAVAEE